MSTTLNKYPSFDLSEIIPENAFVYKIYQPLKPVKTGDSVTGFSLNAGYKRLRRFYNGAEIHGSVLSDELSQKPLVISFYSKYWREAGLRQLAQLNAMQNDIRANGGNLLIISAENDENLSEIAWQNNLSLSFYHDADNEVALKFSVYSEGDPTWSRFSGIDVNVPLPATYVIGLSKQIVYDNVERDYTDKLLPGGIISTVYGASLIKNNRRSA